MATVDDFRAFDVRVGTIISARPLRGARRPSYALVVDFGPLGQRSGSARIAGLYEAPDLVGLQVTAIVNLPPKRVAGFESQVLVLALDDGRGDHVLLIPERPVPDGGKVS